MFPLIWETKLKINLSRNHYDAISVDDVFVYELFDLKNKHKHEYEQKRMKYEACQLQSDEEINLRRIESKAKSKIRKHVLTTEFASIAVVYIAMSFLENWVTGLIP